MSRIRMFLVIAIGVVAMGALAPSGLAGGWAVTTLDPIADDLVPGRSVDIGYTIRQHGQRPVDVAGTGIEIQPPGGPARFFAGRREGPAGHYVARITVPFAGAEWTARQGWFAPQPLGAVPVANAERVSAAPTANASGSLHWVLLVVTALSAFVLSAQVVRRIRRTAAPAS